MWVVEALGEVLRSRREQLGMSQAGLAAAAGVSLRQVGRYESGEQQPVLGVALSLAEALGMTLNEMGDRSEPSRSSGSPPGPCFGRRRSTTEPDVSQ
ncbi:MAG: helix-turn-helix transcriptional regulator [Chloroflexi bacterium]|nr:MAG: helix-turn-helix transcriptional regulator [Chloroflexota bacterium]